MSNATALRNEHRDSSTGKFTRNPCDCCGKGAPLANYYSDPRCNDNGGFGAVLHVRCAAKLEGLSDADYAAFAAFVSALNAW